MKCIKCGNKTILASGTINEFYPDSEPYEAGKVEDCGFEEIITDKRIQLSIDWCPSCCQIEINDTEIV